MVVASSGQVLSTWSSALLLFSEMFKNSVINLFINQNQNIEIELTVWTSFRWSQAVVSLSPVEEGKQSCLHIFDSQNLKATLDSSIRGLQGSCLSTPDQQQQKMMVPQSVVLSKTTKCDRQCTLCAPNCYLCSTYWKQTVQKNHIFQISVLK